MYVLNSEITIGDKLLSSVNNVEIYRSLYNLSATAKIRVPVTAVLKHENVMTYTETAKEINIGDAVVVKLGYDDRMTTEFVGYVKSLNYTAPLEIVCEDEFYQTRSTQVQFSGSTTLKDLLEKCGLTIGYATDLTIAQYETRNRSAAQILRDLATRYSLNIWFDIEGKVYAHALNEVVSDEVNYILRYNVLSDDDLTYHFASDVKIKIKAKCVYRDGSEVEASVGDDGGDERTVYFYDVESESELATLANAELMRRSYDGYSGSITTFLEPHCEPTNVAVIVDEVYATRNGSYLVEGVKTTFGRSGARRVIEVGIKV